MKKKRIKEAKYTLCINNYKDETIMSSDWQVQMKELWVESWSHDMSHDA